MLSRAQQVADDIIQSDRTLAQWEQEIGPLSTVMRRLVGQQLEQMKANDAAPTTQAPNREAPPSAGGAGESPAAAAGAGAAGDVQAARVASAADEVARLDPEMLVQLDGMDAPARVGDLLAAVKEEAARDAEMGRLVEVAAQCALRT